MHETRRPPGDDGCAALEELRKYSHEYMDAKNSALTQADTTAGLEAGGGGMSRALQRAGVQED